MSTPGSVDYIVIGAGAAGCAIARRLGVDGASSVLLLEAGEWTGREDDVAVPGAALARLGRPQLSWGDALVPQAALHDRAVPLAQGRGLGGGSSLNLMVWLRGHPADYEAWVAAGADGWDSHTMEAMFARIERRGGGPTDAPMIVSTAQDLHPVSGAFLAAANRCGVPISSDLNGVQRDGVGLSPANIAEGRRWSVVDGYLDGAVSRGSVTVATGAHVERILLDGARAVGVEYRERGTKVVAATAERAVIVTAGAIRSPQLLMLSGIGDPEHLRDLEIPCRVEAPGVGRGLSDHPIIYPTWRVANSAGLLTSLDASDTQLYELLHRGPLASLAQVVAMVQSEPALSAPDIQMFLVRAGLDDDLMPLPEPAVSCGIALLTPRSRGSVRLASADPLEAPRIDPAFLDDPRDLDGLRRGLDLARRIFETAPLANLVDSPISPGAGPDIDSPVALDEWIRDHVYSEWHPTGTLRMGTGEKAVVDPHTMLVHGTSNLHVADASVMPTIPRGNTQAPTIAIAERAAGLIRQ